MTGTIAGHGRSTHDGSRLDSRIRGLRLLAVLTVVATYLLLVLGSTVRVTNSGMGCPGWPLCSGRVGPISQFHPLMEQSHRYLATIVTVLIILIAGLAFRAGPQAKFVRVPSLIAVGMIAIQVVLGAVTVITNNAPVTVALHLVVGLIFMGAVTVTAVATFIGYEQSWMPFRHRPSLAWAALGGLFLIVITGTLVVDGGAQSACTSHPACIGSPEAGGLVAIQLAHRTMVLIVGTLLVVYLVSFLRGRSARVSTVRLAQAGLLLLAVQVIVGLFDATLGAPAGLADVHLALASALWTVVVAVFALSATDRISTDPSPVAQPL